MTNPDSDPDDDNANPADAYQQNVCEAAQTTAEWDADLVKRDAFGAALNAEGYADVLVLSRERGREILTEDRLEIIDHLREQSELTTIEMLAQEFARDGDAVHDDLDRLAELDVIEYDHSIGDPRPMHKHAHIVVEPIY